MGKFTAEELETIKIVREINKCKEFTDYEMLETWEEIEWNMDAQ